MPITSLKDLKKNDLFIDFNRQQSEFDSQDSATLNDKFTRSPIHAIQFLIVYAGLDGHQRNQVITQLNNPLITKERIEALIQDIDWVAILKKTPEGNAVIFTVELTVVNKDIFLAAIRQQSDLNLFVALTDPNNIVRISEGLPNTLGFKTTVSQQVSWAIPFKPSYSPEMVWTVPMFNLSPCLQRFVAGLYSNSSRVKGGFTIQKGTGAEIILNIVAPTNSNEFSINSEIVVEAGIYDAFCGLVNFYGIEKVDEVIVKIKSESEFSETGAVARQSQMSRFEKKSCKLHQGTPTTITVRDLNVFFHGMDIVANFTEGTKKADDFDPKLYIELPIQGTQGETRIILLAQPPKPAAAFALTTLASIADDGSFVLKDPVLRASAVSGARLGLFSRGMMEAADDCLVSLKSSCSIS